MSPSSEEIIILCTNGYKALKGVTKSLLKVFVMKIKGKYNELSMHIFNISVKSCPILFFKLNIAEFITFSFLSFKKNITISFVSSVETNFNYFLKIKDSKFYKNFEYTENLINIFAILLHKNISSSISNKYSITVNIFNYQMSSFVF